MTNGSDQELARLQQVVDELTALNEIAAEITVTMDMETITHAILSHCLQKTNASQGALFLLDAKEAQSSRFRTFVRRVDQQIGEIPLHLDHSITGWILKNKTVLHCNEPDCAVQFSRLELPKRGIRSILAAPLQTRQGIIGVLAIFNGGKAVGFDDNDKRFLSIVGSQTAQKIENARLFEAEQKLRGIEEELRTAQKIQTGFLPRIDILTPELEICGASFPARQVGGDFYDIYSLSDTRYFLSIGDVADKGMPAALLMANAQAVARSNLAVTKRPRLRNLASNINQVVCQLSTPGQFITAWYGLLDTQKKELSYVNAGHPSAILVKHDGGVYIPPPGDCIIGINSALSYTESCIQLRGIKAVLLYTDGITEAFDDREVQFGENRLIDLMTQCANESAMDIRDKIVQEVADFRGSHEQSDDMTLIVIRCNYL